MAAAGAVSILLQDEEDRLNSISRRRSKPGENGSQEQIFGQLPIPIVLVEKRTFDLVRTARVGGSGVRLGELSKNGIEVP